MVSPVCCTLSPPDIHFPHHQSKISDRNPLLMHKERRHLVSAPSIWQIGTMQRLYAQVDVIHRSVFIQMLGAVTLEDQVLLSPLPCLVCACYKAHSQRSAYNRSCFAWSRRGTRRSVFFWWVAAIIEIWNYRVWVTAIFLLYSKTGRCSRDRTDRGCSVTEGDLSLCPQYRMWLCSP